MAGNKLYTEVTAQISFVSSKEDAMKIYEHFVTRRGITILKDLQSIGRHRVGFEVTYRVHGGWRSDFEKKLTTDAEDTQATLSDLEIIIHRKEIPAECPRKECNACTYALNPGFRPAEEKTYTQPVKKDKKREVPDTLVQELEKTRRRFFNRF